MLALRLQRPPGQQRTWDQYRSFDRPQRFHRCAGFGYADFASSLLISLGDHLFQRRNEPVAVSGKSLNETGVVRGITERLAKPHHRGIQAVVKIDERVVGPEPFSQLFARDNFTAPLEEQG